jgi:hypothetical protein
MTRTPNDDIRAQEARIETASRDFLEDFLAGKASVEFRPLAGADSLAANVGGEKGVSVLSGFAIRLVPGR